MNCDYKKQVQLSGNLFVFYTVYIAGNCHCTIPLLSMYVSLVIASSYKCFEGEQLLTLI